MAADVFRAIRDGNTGRVREIFAAVTSAGAGATKEWLAQESSAMRNTPLMAAVTANNMVLVRLFLEAGADPTVRNASGNTVLHSAAQKGHTELLAFFMTRPDTAALIDAKNNGEWTALNLAARDGHRDAVNLFLSRGAQIHPDDAVIARERGHTDIADLLLEKFAQSIRWIGAPVEELQATAEDPGVFLLAGGHGAEDYDEHDIVPPGRTLVTMAKCGSMIFNAETFQKLAGVFTSEAADLAKLLLLKVDKRAAGIEDFLGVPRGTLRIYKEGERCPRLFYLPVDIQRLPGVAVYNKSGIYAMPTERSHLFEGNADRIQRVAMADTEPITDDLVAAMYAGSVYPTVAGAQALFHAVEGDMHRFESLAMTPMPEIMERLGAGVYFFAVCRASMKPLNVDIFVRREYNRDPETFRPFVLDVPGRFAEIVARYNPALAANTEGRIAAIMERRARSSSERRRKQRGGLRRRTRRRVKRTGSSYTRSR
jgi:Ankyrin repeats (3 copies)